MAKMHTYNIPNFLKMTFFQKQSFCEIMYKKRGGKWQIMYGGIEAGGTKFNCIVANGDRIISWLRARFPTTTPAETFGQVIDFFRNYPTIVSIGIACFGPLDLDPTSPKYGFITSTPKLIWIDTDITGWLNVRLICQSGSIPMSMLLPWLKEYGGSVRDLDSFVYFTIGTGDRRRRSGQWKTAAWADPSRNGTYRPSPRPPADPFPGSCPYHVIVLKPWLPVRHPKTLGTVR